jgi:hypothetical protein
MATNKEIVQLKGKTYIYYSNKGLVLRMALKIPWTDRNLPQNKELIDAMVKKLRDAVFQYGIDHGVNPSRDYIRDILKEGSMLESKKLLDYYSEFVASKKEQVDKGELLPTSMSDISSLKSALTGFEEQSKTKFRISDVNEDFIGRFNEYLLNVKKVSSNTAQKRINSLKGFMKYCQEKKYI